jgi:CheY-like chemotaxis protein
VYLPCAKDRRLEAAVVPIGAAQSSRKGAIVLLVDDDSAVRDVTASILEDLGYVVLKLGSGGAALDLLDRDSNVDLVLLDFAMPGMSGVEVARQIQLKLPAIPILFVTGYADKSALRDVGEERIIKKPFIGDELANKVNAALVKGISHHGGKVVVPLRR